jgi:glycosyltransferase involved in cell wall biosynthesis
MRSIDLPLVVVGRVSDDAKAYATRCYEAGKGRVKFIDQLPYNSPLLASAYAGAEAFVLPSISEIAPNTTLEAAMAGTRIVVTRNSLAPVEWFGDNATYIDPLDEGDIAKKLINTINSHRNTLFRERIIREFSWEAGAQKLIQVYRNVLENDGSKDGDYIAECY